MSFDQINTQTRLARLEREVAKANAAPVLSKGAQIPWTDVTGKPTFFSGAYADLTGKPILFDGAYSSLTGKPSLFSGAYADLTGKPALFSGAYADLTGKPAALGLEDWWSVQRFSISAPPDSPFLGAAISSGSASTAIPMANVPNWATLGIFFRSSAIANSGYRVQTGSIASDYFGGASHKFRCKFLWRATATHTVRIGYHDTQTVTDAVDGAYFEIVGTTISAKTAANSVRTAAPTTATLVVDRVYTFDIDVDAEGTSARFRVYENLNATPILDQTITTNLPVTSARVFGAGIVATQSAAVATDIGVLFEMGLGTIAGFERWRG